MDWISENSESEATEDFYQWYAQNFGTKEEAALILKKWYEILNRKMEMEELERDIGEEAYQEEIIKILKTKNVQFEGSNVWHFLRLKPENKTYCGKIVSEEAKKSEDREDLIFCKKCEKSVWIKERQIFFAEKELDGESKSLPF